MILTDQEGEELDDCEELTSVAASEKIRELNVFDDTYLDAVEHVHDEEKCDFHAHGDRRHCAFQCEISNLLQVRAQVSAENWVAMAMREYVRHHAWMFETPIDLARWLTPELAEALLAGDEAKLRALVRTESNDTKLFNLPFFNDEACRSLIEEVEAFEANGLPASRPNSMNSYGLILDQIGMRDAIEELRDRAVLPLLRVFYDDDAAVVDLIDDHHAFIVQYAGNGATTKGDVDLGFHYDESEFTLNVCLGREFTGSRLYFRGLLLKRETHNEELTIAHERGRGLLHIGKHRHGAEPIESGERFNLILWLRASALRRGCHHGHGHGHDHGQDHDHHHDDDDDDDDNDHHHDYHHDHRSSRSSSTGRPPHSLSENFALLSHRPRARARTEG